MLKYNHNKKKGKMKMKTYVVTFVDLFDGNMKSDIIYSDKTELEVLQEYLLAQWNNAKNLTEEEKRDTERDVKKWKSVDDCKEYCFDCDFLCNIIEVPKK